MARITDGILPTGAQLGLSLDRYQEIMDLPICAFNGLNNPNEVPTYECSAIWKQSQRDMLAIHLQQAEEKRENELGYFLAPKYTTEERHLFQNVIILRWKHLIAVGIKATTTLSSGATLTHRNGSAIIDPVELTVSTDVTDKEEIRVFYPGEDVEIRPSKITISGGTATIRIPRARLVKPDLLDNREDPLMYDDDDNFLETVDVKRVYTDPTNAGSLVWTTTQLAMLGQQTYPSGAEATQTAVASLYGERAQRLSKIQLFPAEYANETWTGKNFRYPCLPDRADISYLSGVQSSMRTEVLTARLAHTLMPHVPCNCPYVDQYYKDDNERVQGMWTPYGNKTGAVEAWLEDTRYRIGIGGMVR